MRKGLASGERYAHAMVTPAIPQRDVPRVVPAVAVALVAALYVAVVWHNSAPVFYNDEMGALGPSMLLARPTTQWTLIGSGFMPGIAILITPLWWFTADPQTVYRLASAVQVLLSLATLVPLAHLARRFGAAPRASWLLAAVVMVAPARAINANYVWSETLLFLLVVWAWEFLWRLRPDAPRTALALGALAGATFVAHGRALPFAAVVVCGGLWMVRRSLTSAVALLVGAGATAGAGWLLFVFTQDEMYAVSNRVGNTLESVAGLSPASYVVAIVGLSWYQLAAWAGLTFVGAVIALRMARSERWRGPAAVVCASALVSFLASPAIVARSEGLLERIDAHFYGRYLDPFVAGLAVIGLARLTRALTWRASAVVAGASVASAALFVVLVAPGIPRQADLTLSHVPGVAYLLDPVGAVRGDPESWAMVAFVGTAAAVAVAAASLRRWAAVALAGVWFAGLTLWTDVRIFDHFEESMRAEPGIAQAVASIDTSVDMFVDISAGDAVVAGNRLTFWMAPRDYIYMDPRNDLSDVQMFLGTPDSETARAYGAREYLPASGGNLAVWIMPGDLQDELAEQGLLESAPESAS